MQNLAPRGHYSTIDWTNERHPSPIWHVILDQGNK